MVYLQDQHLDEKFPEEKRPRIHELEEKTAAGFQFGHPLLFSGNRPVPSNLVYLGMMNCRAPNPIDDPALMKFMDSPAAKKHGVILVTFGSLLKSKITPCFCKNGRPMTIGLIRFSMTLNSSRKTICCSTFLCHCVPRRQPFDPVPRYVINRTPNFSRLRFLSLRREREGP